MKTICSILSSLLIFGLPVLFAANGYGIDTWEYWGVLSGVSFANILGIFRGKDGG